MIGLLVLAVVGVAFVAALVGAVVLRSLFWLVLLPFRLLFALLILPFLLIKAIFAGLIFLVAGPIVGLLAVIAAIVLTAALAIPLAPALLVIGAVYLLTRPRTQALVRT